MRDANDSPMSGATPRPWAIDEEPAPDGGLWIQGDGKALAIAGGPQNAEGLPDLANARLIVRAVNAHDELVATLRETLRQLSAPDCPPIPDGAMVRGRIVSVLARLDAEGGR